MSEYVMKACPFCGNSNIAEDEGCYPSGDGFEVRCGNPFCYAHEPQRATFAEAIEVWNTRAAAPTPPAGDNGKLYQHLLDMLGAKDHVDAGRIIGELPAAAAPREPAPAVDGGMLPDALVPHAKEWYRLCERRFAVDRMTISGELAEAIVSAMGAAPPAPRVDELQRDAERYRWLRTENSWVLIADELSTKLTVYIEGKPFDSIGPDDNEFDKAIDAAIQARRQQENGNG